jgi:hypothetical protein
VVATIELPETVGSPEIDNGANARISYGANCDDRANGIAESWRLDGAQMSTNLTD